MNITRLMPMYTACLFVLSSALPSVCYAYVDPTTGGYIFQLLFPIISAVAAILLFFRNGVRRALDIVLRRKPPELPK